MDSPEFPALRGASGRLDARRVAAALGVTLEDVAAALGGDVSALAADSDADALQDPVAPLARLAALLGESGMTPDARREWWARPAPGLRYRAPLHLLRLGQISALTGALEDALDL